MISVLNHLLPLNGSRQVTYILLPIFLVLFSCGASKNVAYTPEIVPVVQPKDPVIKEDTVKAPIIIENPVMIDTVIEVIKKNNYDIALLLPFSLDNQDYQPVDLQNANFKKSTEMSIEFFQGFQLAINEIQKSDIEVEIVVLDTKNDQNNVKQILNSQPFPKVDLIIGPVYNKNLRIAAEYCMKNKIPMISPLSSSSSITTNNPYYYSANGTSESHYETMMQYIHKNYPNDTLHIIHNSTPRERSVIESLKLINDEYEGTPTVFTEIPLTIADDITTIKSQFDSLDNHLVFIPSTNEQFATYALSQLANINTYFSSIVFGMPNWNSFKNIDFDYFESLQVHLTESYWANEHNIDVGNFTNSFIFTYQMPPSEYAFQGYDLANYVLNYLAKNDRIKAANKEDFFTYDALDIGLQTKFKFIPRKNEDDKIVNYWDNSYIHVLKFENYMFNKVD